ncbi:MAG: transposase family protein [Trueperaceae bacterium]
MKKRHTQKAQVVVAKKTKQVVCTFTGKGREHDFNLFKRSALSIHPDLELKADKGYQGVKGFHANSQTPPRKLPKRDLSKEQRAFNRKLASERMAVEHVIGKLQSVSYLAGATVNVLAYVSA